MNIVNPQSPRKSAGRMTLPLLKSQIEEAQRNTNSNMAAARWLGASYIRYKKYAKLYGLFDKHLNQEGFGIDKGFSKNPQNTPLSAVLANKHPNYSPAKLKNRLLARKKLEEKCYLCGFDEKRITDKKCPLMLNFIDGDTKNYSITNLNLLCYNCMFLTTGAPSVVYKRNIEKSFYNSEKLPKTAILPDITEADYIDKSPNDYQNIDIELSEEEKWSLMNDDD